MTIKKPATQRKHREIVSKYRRLRREGHPVGTAVDRLASETRYHFAYVYRILQDYRLV